MRWSNGSKRFFYGIKQIGPDHADFVNYQDFDSATAANDWWQANRNQYARDLVEKE